MKFLSSITALSILFIATISPAIAQSGETNSDPSSPVTVVETDDSISINVAKALSAEAMIKGLEEAINSLMDSIEQIRTSPEIYEAAKKAGEETYEAGSKARKLAEEAMREGMKESEETYEAGKKTGEETYEAGKKAAEEAEKRFLK